MGGQGRLKRRRPFYVGPTGRPVGMYLRGFSREWFSRVVNFGFSGRFFEVPSKLRVPSVFEYFEGKLAGVFALPIDYTIYTNKQRGNGGTFSEHVGVRLVAVPLCCHSQSTL